MSNMASPGPQVQMPLRSHEPERIKNTVIERKPKVILPPRQTGSNLGGLLSPTGNLLSPTTPFSPMLSPAMPVSPRLVTRKERKAAERTMGSLVAEMAKSDAELW
jgi:hypothetical protein